MFLVELGWLEKDRRGAEPSDRDAERSASENEMVCFPFENHFKNAFSDIHRRSRWCTTVDCNEALGS